MLEITIPILLVIIMISMGMELGLDDFRRIVQMPRATLVGLAGQMLLLPLVGLVFAHWPGFSPSIAMGVVIVTACPGGAASNLFSYVARANLALSVTLTSLSSSLCFVTIPFWIDIGAHLFMHEAGSDVPPVQVPLLRTFGQLFVVTLLPISIGMGIRARFSDFTARIRTRLRRGVTSLMAVALVVLVGSEWERVVHDLSDAAMGALVLVASMLGVAYGLARAARLDDRDAFTISIEVGMQNGALASTIVVALLQRPELLIFPGAYAVLSFVPVAIWTAAMRRRFAATQASPAA
jgi:BASS family bile acid:Na+ symporter